MSVKAAAAKSKAPRTNSVATKTAAKKPTAEKKPAKQAAVSAKRESSSSAQGKSSSAAKKTSAPSAIAPAEVAHRLHLLLHSIHQIERYEERLCQMQDAIKRTGRVAAPLLRDLRALLDELPSDEFQHDLDAVQDAVRSAVQD